MSVNYYDENADAYFRETVSADLNALRMRFLAHVSPGGHILDSGCGSGRDARAFLEAGYRVTAFDASAEMVKLAAAHTGLDVKLMTFSDMGWAEEFDGVWACASLLHVPSASFAEVASRFAAALRPGGAWYLSFKLGEGQRVAQGRIFVDHTEETLRRALMGVPVQILEVWTSEDVRPDRAGERWLNAIAVRPATVPGGRIPMNRWI